VAGSGLVVVICTAGFTVTVRLCEALTALAVSVTVTEKLKGVAELAAGAVPDKIPEADKLSHAGRPVDCHVNGVVPPLSANVWLYAIPDVVAGKDVVVTEGGALMVKANVFVAEAEVVSVTRKVKLTGPVAVGVPLSTPALEMVSHEGKVDPLSAKVSAPVPPTAAMV
jgi:hypothetical protein